MRRANQFLYTKIQLPFKIKEPTLAFGSHLKNTTCFLNGNTAYLTKVHQDLSNPKDLLNFERSIRYFLKKRPKRFACDLHPEYQSSKSAQLYARRRRLYAIQHHHAHIASCLAENELLNQRVIGVAFDGTGLGIDNHLWGAEFLLCDYKKFIRKAHLKEIPLLGGEQAILEPWRLGCVWLYLAYGDRFLNLKIDFSRHMQRKKWAVLKQMLMLRFNTPLASSMGRLFYAVASIVLDKHKADFEADLAIELERIGATSCPTTTPYHYSIAESNNKYIINPVPIFKGVVQDLTNGVPEAKIAYKFHLTVAHLVNALCVILRKDTRINRIVLSGGVFQNKLLLRLVLDLLYTNNFKVFTHQRLSCGDAGISLGQAAIANFGS